MAIDNLQDQDKLRIIERLLIREQRAIMKDRETINALRHIAKELRARTAKRRAEALIVLDGKIWDIKRATTSVTIGSLGRAVLTLWPTVRQALVTFNGGEFSKEQHDAITAAEIEEV